MKQEWLDLCTRLASSRDFIRVSARKVIRNVHYTFEDFGDDLSLADCGYSKSKQSMLIRNYLNEESRDTAVKLWERRCEQNKYGSVGFTTYNHLIKGGGLRNPWERAAKVTGIPARPGSTMGGRRVRGQNTEHAPVKTSRASVMGPCLQSVTLTLIDSKHPVTVDVFYRTTEIYKKFPADLVFIRDILLPPFHLKKPIVNFHFANVTVHPMYWITIAPHLDDIEKHLERIRRSDPYLYKWIIRWTSRYILPEEHGHGIQKFAQALRVAKDAHERIDKRTLKDLQRYCRKNHPGYDRAVKKKTLEEIEEDPE